MNYYVLIPELTPYEGIKVDETTKIEYENERVKQKIENLVLDSVYIIETEDFKSENHFTLKLKKGDILLFEGENRGYFLPKDVKVCTIKKAIEDYETLALALDGDENDSKRNEN